MRKHSALCALIVTLAFFVIGCAAEKRISSIETPYLNGIDTSLSKKNLPFDHVWTRSGVYGHDFDRLYLKPIRLDYLPTSSWINSASGVITSERDYLDEAKLVANHVREELIRSIQEHPANHFTLVNKAGPRTLVLEIAITELEFSHPVTRAASLAVPVPGAGAAVSAVSDPHITFAAKAWDGSSGQLVGTLADRKFAPARIVDINKLTVTSSAREIGTNWAKTMAAALNNKPEGKVDEEGRYALLPW